MSFYSGEMVSYKFKDGIGCSDCKKRIITIIKVLNRKKNILENLCQNCFEKRLLGQKINEK